MAQQIKTALETSTMDI